MDELEQLRQRMNQLKLKALQDKMRLDKATEFGSIGKKTDCKHCAGSECLILRGLYCTQEICYFYDKKD